MASNLEVSKTTDAARRALGPLSRVREATAGMYGTPVTAPADFDAWDLYFSDNPVCEVPDFVNDRGIDLAARLDGTPLMVLSRESRDAAPRTPQQRQRESIGPRPSLPITLEPPNSEDFLDALLRTKKAWIQVIYQDGRTEVQPWNAGNMRPSSNVMGNLRSRHEFRSGAWQKNKISSVKGYHRGTTQL